MIGLAIVIAIIMSLGSGGPLDLRAGAARQDLAAAVTHYAKAPVVHLTGGFSHDGHSYQVDVSIDGSGDSQGTVVADGKKVDYRYTGQHAYVMAGQDYWASDARMAAFLAGKWVTRPDLAADLSTEGMRKSLSLVDLAKPGVTFTKRGKAARVNGVPAEVLSDHTGDLYLSTSKPIRFLRLVTSPSYRTPDGITDVRVDLDYPTVLNVQAPSPVVDTDDPATLPAQYTVEPDTFAFGTCATSAGCTLSAVVRNRKGPQVGSPTAEFVLTRADGGDLGRCTAAIQPAGHDQTETVSCTVTGSAWAAFTRVGGRYLGQVTVHNPFYDS